jgi:NADPH:quinone reductase
MIDKAALCASFAFTVWVPNAPKTVAPIYGVAGGLGQLMTPWAQHLGAFVIGVVINGDGVAKARALGYDATIIWEKTICPSVWPRSPTERRST